MKLEEREVMINRITAQCEVLQHENYEVLMENGHLTDSLSAFEMSTSDIRLRQSREWELFAPHIDGLESRYRGLLKNIERNTLNINLMANSVGCRLEKH